MISLRDIYKGGHVSPEDLQLLYDILKERPPEANISHREMPSFEQHRQFVTRRPYEAWYMIEHSEQVSPITLRAGTIYLTHQREVGIFMMRAFQKAGWAREALKILRQQHPGRILANVAPGNERSHKFFQAAGGRLIQLTYEL